MGQRLGTLQRGYQNFFRRVRALPQALWCRVWTRRKVALDPTFTGLARGLGVRLEPGARAGARLEGPNKRLATSDYCPGARAEAPG
jgi:hypothetical protein